MSQNNTAVGLDRPRSFRNDLLGRADAFSPRIRYHGASRPDHQTRLAPGAVGGHRMVKILPKTSLIGGIRERVAQRRGNPNIGAVAAARKQLELVFYALRDHHVRALHRRAPRAA